MEQLTFSEQIQQFIANHSIMVGAWVALFVAVIFTFYKAATCKYQIVNNAEATRLVNKEDGVVLDLRSDGEFNIGHILGSIQALPSDLKAGKAVHIEKYKETPVILVDVNGLTVGGIAEAMVKQGFNKVYVLKDGILGWRAANLPTVKK